MAVQQKLFCKTLTRVAQFAVKQKYVWQNSYTSSTVCAVQQNVLGGKTLASSTVCSQAKMCMAKTVTQEVAQFAVPGPKRTGKLSHASFLSTESKQQAEGGDINPGNVVRAVVTVSRERDGSQASPDTSGDRHPMMTAVDSSLSLHSARQWLTPTAKSSHSSRVDTPHSEQSMVRVHVHLYSTAAFTPYMSKKKKI